MKDYELVNDTIVYNPEDFKKKTTEKTVKPKKKSRTEDSFKNSYFTFYDDIKTNPKEDW